MPYSWLWGPARGDQCFFLPMEQVLWAVLFRVKVVVLSRCRRSPQNCSPGLSTVCCIWSPHRTNPGDSNPAIQTLESNPAIQTLETNPANHLYPKPSPDPSHKWWGDPDAQLLWIVRGDGPLLGGTTYGMTVPNKHRDLSICCLIYKIINHLDCMDFDSKYC